jgi:hypothetical protein
MSYIPVYKAVLSGRSSDDQKFLHVVVFVFNGTFKCQQEATPKHKGLKSKTSDEKRGNPKHGVLKSKTSNKKRM